MPSRRGRVEDQDYVARNLSLHNNANIYVFEDITARSLPDEKILTRGKCGATCYKARGRPSNASSDPVPEKHAPTAALEGANKSRVNLRSVKIFSRGAGRNFGSREHDLVGCGHLQPGLHFPESGRRLLGNISSGSQGMSWRRVPEAEQAVLYSECEYNVLPQKNSAGDDIILRLAARLRDTDMSHRASACGKL